LRSFKVKTNDSHKSLLGCIGEHTNNVGVKIKNLYERIDATGKFENLIANLVSDTSFSSPTSDAGIIEIKITNLDSLVPGTVLNVSELNVANVLYDPSSMDNALFCTNNCDNLCIMCSQPPLDREDYQFFHDLNLKIVDLIDSNCLVLGLTGGEPLLHPTLFACLLSRIRDRLPTTQINILTNGRAFSDSHSCKSIAEVASENFVWEIPVHSDSYVIHDHIAGKNGAFLETFTGLLKFSESSPRISIRHIIQKSNATRVNDFARFVSKNLPFVESISFMGLEYVGYAKKNLNEIHLDLKVHQTELEAAVFLLSSSGINVSIFNLPLCMLKESLWDYAYKSIDSHKRHYLPICDKCSVINECGGIFRSNETVYSDSIHPL
jgi:His-Xaa-Ser system radical SAM maturase HxsC